MGPAFFLLPELPVVAMEMSHFSPLYLAGQTGSGKTGVAIELAKRLESAEVINADAFQIYRGIEILSAAPSLEEQDGIKHHLFGIYDLSEECDVASFAKLARSKIDQLSGEIVPIVVGGSGLYLKSITHGLGPTPPGDETLRARLAQQSLEELVAQYEILDPDGAASTNLKNRRYVTRNLEICLLSGEPASRVKAGWERDAPEFRGIYLKRSREDIYERINRRTEQMFAAGVVEEIRSLTGPLSQTAAKAIGVREIRALIAGEISKEDCIAAIQQITRRYAKRQETWFRKESQYRIVDCGPNDTAPEMVDQILKIFPVSELLDRG